MKMKSKKAGGEAIQGPRRNKQMADFFREQLGYEPAEEPPEQGVPVRTGRERQPVPGGLLCGQKVSVALDRKGRRGKTVTVITRVHLAPGDLDRLARELRQACGAGGAIVNGAIEIQGDQRERAEKHLTEWGAVVRRVGG